MVLIEIAAALESQLKIVSEVSGDALRFSSDGRLLHLPSLVRTAAWDDRCSGVEGKIYAVPSWVRGRSAGPCDVGKSCGFAQIKQLNVTRGSHSAWSRCQPRFSTAADQAGEGSRGWAATPRCTAFYTPITHITAAHGTEVRKYLAAFPRELGSVERHAEVYPLLRCGHLRSLRWVSVMDTGDLDESGTGGSERLHATHRQLSEPDARPNVSSHGTRERLRSRQQSRNTWNWPLLGLTQPGARTRSPCGETSHSSQATRRGEQTRKGQGRRGKTRVPATSKWVPMFFALTSSVSRETEFTKFVSEEIATARFRHASRRRRIPMPACPRHRSRCNRHEARAGIVALISFCLVRLSTGGFWPSW